MGRVERSVAFPRGVEAGEEVGGIFANRSSWERGRELGVGDLTGGG